MASAFNLTAQLNLRGPSNIGKIVSDIRRQLGTVKGNVDLKINAASAKNITQLNSALRTLSANLRDVQANATSAASAISTFTGVSSGFSSSSASASNNIAKTNTSLNTLTSTSKTASKQLAVARTEMEEFGRQSALAVRRFAAFSAATGAIFAVTNAFRQAFGAYVEFDKAFVKVQQVTDKTAGELQGLVKEVKDLSVGLGVTSSDLINVASTLAQAGLSAKDTEKALRALALSDLAPSFDNINDTVEGSIALMRQFGISAGELESALGSVNAVAAAFAVEAGDIIAAIQRTGGVFASASKGVSEGTDALNEFIAVFTSVRQTTRESAETIATGLRTIFTRIQRESTIEALREYGVVLTDAEGKFVGAYKAVQLLSEGLNRIDPRDIKFSQIVEELGGFRQIGKVIPLIQQFAVAQQALAVAQKGQGSLASDAIKAQLSLANQITKVREEFLAFVREIGSSDTFQTLARTSLGFASSLIKVASALKGVLPVLAILGLGKAAGAVTEFGSGFIGGLKKSQKDQGGNQRSLPSSLGSRLGGAVGGGPDYSRSLDALDSTITANISAIESLSNNISNLINSLSTINNFSTELTNNTASLVANTASIDALTAAVTSLNLGGGTTLNSGGRVLAFARGGVVPGSGRGDKIPALLEPQEFVINRNAANKVGRSNLERLNSGGIARFKDGEIVKASPNTEKAHFGSIVALTSDQIKKAILSTKDKKLAFAIQESLGSKDTSQAGLVSGVQEFVNELSSAELNQIAKNIEVEAKRSVKLTIPSTFNQALRRGNPDLVSQKDLIDWTVSNPKITSSLPAEVQKVFTNGVIASRLSGIGPRQRKDGIPAYDVDDELAGLGDEIANQFNINAIDLMFKGASKDFIQQLGLDPKRARKQDRVGNLKLNSGGLAQAFAEGGKVVRNLGYIDYDVIANEANKSVVEAGMKKAGVTGPRLYSDYLTDLAVKARKENSLDKLRAIYGVAGSGKTTLARGQGTDVGTLRETNRFPILSPEDIQKASEVLILTSSVSKDKMEGFLSQVDRAYTISSTTAAEKERVKSQRTSRDTTGVGLEGRKPGTTTGVSTSTAVGEALLLEALGEKSVVLGRKENGGLRRKSGKELVEVIKKRIGFTWGGFAPTTAGHESIMDAAAAMGIAPEDFIALVGANEGIKAGDPSSYRTAIFDQDFRVLLAKAGFGGRGATVLPKPRDFEVPQAFDITKPGDERSKVVVPARGSTAFVADKTPEQTQKYKDAGYSVKNIERTGGISGTMVRDLILSGDTGKLQEVLSPDVFKLISANIGRLQNRANILPSLIDQVSKSESASLADIDKQIDAVGIKRVDAKKVASDPEYAAKAEVLKELRERKTKLKAASSFEPYKLLARLAQDQPEKYGLIQKLIIGGKVGELAAQKGKSVQEIVMEEIVALGRVAGVKEILGISKADRKLDGLLRLNNIKTYAEDSPQLAEAAKFINQALDAKGTVSAAEETRIGALPKVAIAGLVDTAGKLGYSKDFEWNIGSEADPKMIYAYVRGFQDRYLNAARQMQKDTAEAAGRFAENMQYADIFGTGEPLALDFDGTLVKGADILGENGLPDIPKYADRKAVAESLNKGSLTLLGAKLKTLLDADPNLVKQTRILTARPQSTVDLLANKLQSFGLPYKASDITGVSGPGVDIGKAKAANLSMTEKLIDDSLENIQAAQKSGKKGFLYTEPSARPELDELIGQGNIEGAVIEKALALLGANLPPIDQLESNRAIDFPGGLGRAAQFFGLPSDIPTEIKRTLDGRSFDRARGEFARYFEESAVGFKLGGKVYDMQKGTGLSDREFDELVKFGNTNDYSELEFKEYLSTYLKNKAAKKDLVTNPEQLRQALLSGTRQQQTTSKQLALAEQLKGDPDAKYNPKYDKSISKFAIGGLAGEEGLKSLIAGLYGAPGSVARQFQGAGVYKDSGLDPKDIRGVPGSLDKPTIEPKKEKQFGKIALRIGDRVQATYIKEGEAGIARSGQVIADKINSNLYAVQSSSATKGYGPKLYDVVMEAVTSQGGMLTSDRRTVSDAAKSVWAYYFKNRGDVKKTPLDPENWVSNSRLLDEKLYGKPETWPAPTDPAWILQTGYSKTPSDINDPKLVQKLATGGSTKNAVPALLTPGEAVIGPNLAKKIGYSKLDKMNQADRNGMGRYSGGGDVSIVPGQGNTDTFGPVPLPVGSYVIRKKATKALGFNKGGYIGIQKFATGGMSRADIEAGFNVGRGLDINQLQDLVVAAQRAGMDVRAFAAELIKARDIAKQTSLDQGKSLQEAAEAGRQAAAKFANIDLIDPNIISDAQREAINRGDLTEGQAITENRQASGIQESALLQTLGAASTVNQNVAENQQMASVGIDPNMIRRMAEQARTDVGAKVYASNVRTGADDPVGRTRAQMGEAGQSITGDILRQAIGNKALTAGDLNKALKGLNLRRTELQTQKDTGSADFGMSQMIELKMLDQLGPQIQAKLQQVLGEAVQGVQLEKSIAAAEAGDVVARGAASPLIQAPTTREQAIGLQNEMDVRKQQFETQKEQLSQRQQSSGSPIEAAIIQSQIESLASQFSNFESAAKAAQDKYIAGFDAATKAITDAAQAESDAIKERDAAYQELVSAAKQATADWSSLSTDQQTAIVDQMKQGSAGDRVRAAEAGVQTASENKVFSEKARSIQYGDVSTGQEAAQAVASGSDVGAAKAVADADRAKAAAAMKVVDAEKYMALMARQGGMSLSQYTKQLKQDIGSTFMKLKDDIPKAISNARINIAQSRDKIQSSDSNIRDRAKEDIKGSLRAAVGSEAASGIDTSKLDAMVDQLATKLQDTSVSFEDAIASVDGLQQALTDAGNAENIKARAVEEVAIASGVAKEKLAEFGDEAVNAAQKMDATKQFNDKLQKLALGIAAAGSAIQFAITEFGGTESAGGAAAAAVVGGATQRVGAGLALAGQVQDPKLKGLILLGTAAVTVAGAFKDAHNAVRQFNIDITNKKIEQSMERTSNLFDKFNKDNTKLDVLDSLDKELKNGARLAVQNLQNELTIPKAFWANMLDLGGGQESAQRGNILEKEGLFSYLKSTSIFGGGAEKAAEYRQGAMERLAPEQAVKQAQAAKPQADNILMLLEAQLKASGGKINDVVSGLDKNQSEILARTNPLVNEQIANLQANASLSNEEKKARIDNIIETEAQKVATNQLTASLKQIELEKMDRASRNFVTSLDRMFNHMDRALSKTSFELDSLTRSAELSSLALSGQAQAGDVSLKSINVLQNSRAYSGAEQESARTQAASFFGSQSDTVSGLLQVGDKLEDTVLSTINKTIESSPGASDEKIATNIRFALDKSLTGLGLPSDLSDKISKQAKTAFEEMRAKGQEDVSFDELAERVSGFSRVMDSARRAQELSVKAMEFWQKNLNEYAQAMNTNVALQVETNSQMRRAAQIQYQGQLDLKKAFGKSISLDETRKATTMGIASQTGGATAPRDISRNILGLEDTRRAQQSMSDSAANRGPAGRDEFMLMQNRLSKTNVALRENYDALKQLADSGDLASAALAKIDEVKQKRQAGENVIEKLVTSNPEELTNFRNAMARLQNNMQGNVNAGSTAEQRGESLQAFNMIAPMLGDQQGAVKANVLESMLKESGVGVDSTMQEVIDSLRNPEGDPQMAEAIAAYREGVNLQTEANRVLGELNQRIADNNADIAAQKLATAITGVTLTFDQQNLADINKGIQRLVSLAEEETGKPSGEKDAAAMRVGGIVYASTGKMINFQSKGTDTVPAMLTPGEFVVNRSATSKNLPLLKSINSGAYSKGGSVQYYSTGGVVDLGGYDKPIQETKRQTAEGLISIPEDKPKFYNLWGVKRNFYASPENQSSSDLALGVEEASKNAVLTDWAPRLGGSYDTLDFNQNMTFAADLGATAAGATAGGAAGAAVAAAKKKAAKIAAERAAKEATEAAVKTGAKKLFGGVFKGLFKRIPGVGFLFALKSLAEGNYQMAMMEALSATASLVPGPGTALSLAIDGATILAGAAGGATAAGAIRDGVVQHEPKFDITTESKPGPSKYMSSEPLGSILDPNYMTMLLDEEKIKTNKIDQDKIEEYKAKLKAFRASLPKPVDSNISIKDTAPNWTPKITKMDSGPIKANELTDIGGGGLAQTSQVKLSDLTYQDAGYAALVALTADSASTASSPDSALDAASVSGRASPFGLFLPSIAGRLATLGGDLKLASGGGINIPKNWGAYTKDFANISDQSAGTMRIGLNDTAKYKEQYDQALAQIDDTLKSLGDDTTSSTLKFDETELSSGMKQEALDLTALLDGQVFQAKLNTQKPTELSGVKFPITLYNKKEEDWLKAYDQAKGVADTEFAKTKFVTLKKGDVSKKFPWTADGFKFSDDKPDLQTEANVFRATSSGDVITVTPNSYEDQRYKFSYSSIKSKLLDSTSRQLVGDPLDYILINPQTDKANLEFNPFAKTTEPIYAPSIDNLIAFLNSSIPPGEEIERLIDSGAQIPPHRISLLGGDSMIGLKKKLETIENYASFKDTEVAKTLGNNIGFLVPSSAGKPMLDPATFDLPEYTNARIKRVKDKQLEKAKIKSEKAEGFEKLSNAEALFPEAVRIAIAQVAAGLANQDADIKSVGATLNVPQDIGQVGGLASGLNGVLSDPSLDTSGSTWRNINAWRGLFSTLYKPENPDRDARYLKDFKVDISSPENAKNTAAAGIQNIILREKAVQLAKTVSGNLSQEDAKDIDFEGGKLYQVDPKSGKKTEISPEARTSPKTYADLEKIALTPENVFPDRFTRMKLIEKLRGNFEKSGYPQEIIDATNSLIGWYGDTQDKYINEKVKAVTTPEPGEYSVGDAIQEITQNKTSIDDKQKTTQPSNMLLTGNQYGMLPNADKMIALLKAEVTKTEDKKATESDNSVAALASGGLVYASTGKYINFQPRGTDTVPAMLTPGEFVINRDSTSKYRPVLEAINSGNYNQGGIVKYLQNGGVVFPNYYADAGNVSGRNAAFDFASFMQNLASTLISTIPSAIQKGFEAINASTPQGNTTNGVSSIDTNVLDKLTEFTNRLKSVTDTLAGLEAIPSQITVTGRHDVNVIINGDSALNQLQPQLQSLVMDKFKDAFQRLIEVNRQSGGLLQNNPFTDNTGG